MADGTSAGSRRTAERHDEAGAHDVDVSRHPTPVTGVECLPSARRVLIVEDDAAHAAILCESLVDFGYEVDVVSTGAEAVHEAKRMPPSVVLMDVHLRNEDGFEVAERFAADRRLRAVPIVFVSGITQLASRVRAHQRPGWGFLWKPYRTDELVARVEGSIREAHDRAALRQLANVDELTGLANVRLLEERMTIEMARVRRYATPLSMAVADVDGLKRINDGHGHLVGTEVLRQIAVAIQGEVRETDLAARYGGDEFVILLPHTTLPDALAFGHRLVRRVRVLRPCGVGVSVSVGVSSFEPGQDADLRALLERADDAAYRAKRAGGDGALAAPATR
jgi:diguanylate cyclase (GGDEF)-like protein